MLAVPMLRDGSLIGVITVLRNTIRSVQQRQIEMVETFADQAVIAIENARLFREIQERTAQLARSVEEQRALAEVSQAVSSSLDLQEVLTTIVAHAVELSGGDGGTVYELDEDVGAFVLRATYQMPEEIDRRDPGPPRPAATTTRSWHGRLAPGRPCRSPILPTTPSRTTGGESDSRGAAAGRLPRAARDAARA